MSCLVLDLYLSSRLQSSQLCLVHPRFIVEPDKELIFLLRRHDRHRLQNCKCQCKLTAIHQLGRILISSFDCYICDLLDSPRLFGGSAIVLNDSTLSEIGPRERVRLKKRDFDFSLFFKLQSLEEHALGSFRGAVSSSSWRGLLTTDRRYCKHCAPGLTQRGQGVPHDFDASHQIGSHHSLKRPVVRV